MSATMTSPFQIRYANNAYPRKIPGKTFLPNWWSPDWFCRNWMILNHCTKRNDQAFSWFSESSFVRCCPICEEVLNISQITIAFHESAHHSLSRPDCNSTVDVPPFFLRRLFQLYHSSRIDGVLKHHDSMISLHKICRIPMSCQYKWLSAFPAARRTSVNSFPSPEKFSSYTDKIESTEWPNRVPRQHIYECFGIHRPHWELCDLLSSGHQTSLPEVLLSPVRFLVILVRLQISHFRSSGKWVQKLCFLTATFTGRSESESWDVFASAGTSVSSSVCELLWPLWEIAQSMSRCLNVVRRIASVFRC